MPAWRRTAIHESAAPPVLSPAPAPASIRAGGSAGRSALLPGALALPWLPLLLLATVIAASALARPIIAGIDTPALSAAWEILRDRDWLGWHTARGATALPPLLPWLIALAWSELGIGLGSAWILCALGLIAGFALTRRLAERLWPSRADAGPLASWAFTGSAGMLLLGPAIVPEAIGLAFAASGLLGLAMAGDGRYRGWLLFGLSFALLLLTVGATGLTVLLVPALLGPIWTSRAGRPAWIGWYLAVTAATALAMLPALFWLAATVGLDSSSVLAWATPRGGPSLLPLLALPAFFYPWPFWPRLWRSARRQNSPMADAGIRLCLIALAAPLTGFVAGGEELRRLLLIAPPAAVLIARLLAGRLPGRADFHAAIPGLPLILLGLVPVAINTVPWAQLASRAHQFIGIEELPIWPASIGLGGTLVLLGGVFLLIQATPRLMLSRTAQVALLPVILAGAVALEMTGALGRAFDLSPVAARLAELQSRSAPVAVLGIDPSVYAFPGRLEQPLADLATADTALAWARAHPDGTILAPFRGSVLHLIRQPSYAAPQGKSWFAFWPAETVLETGGAVLAERP